MKKILLSVGTLLFVSAVVAGTTGAFLTDAQTSTGNTFASGLVTLGFDNESFVTNATGTLVMSTSTTWTQSPLAGKLFFNFPDVKPGDIGEDTVSIHVNNNNSWACMDAQITASSTGSGQATSTPSLSELQNDLHFALWGDDGDNVYEKGETIFAQGSAGSLFNGQEWALSDSAHNIWGTPGPLLGGQTYYVGEAWCFGTLTPAPLTQDGKGFTGTNGPLQRGTGFTCDGSQIGNGAQGNTIALNVSFQASQARNNNSFLCGDPNQPPVETTSTLFSQNFQSCTKDTNSGDYGHEYNDLQWSQNWNCKNTGGTQCTQNLTLNAGGTGHSASATTPSFSTVGYHTISLTYSRSTSGGSGTKLVVDYSANGGTTWNTLETVNGNSAQQSETFSLSPIADNQPNVEVRFTVTGTSASNVATVYSLSVTGETP